MLNELIVLAAGYWLAESYAKNNEGRRLDWESTAGFVREGLDLAWQMLALGGLGWAVQALNSLQPGLGLTGPALTLAAAYGLSLLRPRLEGGTESYFLALAALALTVQQSLGTASSAAPQEALALAARLWGGSLLGAALLLGLKDRLRWSTTPREAYGPPLVLLCLALLAVIIRSMGF